MAPNQPLIQPLYILPESEYKVETRTVCSGFQPDREQVLLAIHSRFENLQRQRKKGGGRKDAGQAFVADAEGSLGGKRCSSPSARGRGKRRGGCSRGGYRNHKYEEEEEQHKATGGKAGGGKHLTPRVTAPSVRAVARRNINPSAALIGSAACVVVKAIR